MDNNFAMTDDEMRDRIKEIEKQRQELSDEKRKYETYLYEKKKQEDQKKRECFVGKCFVTKDDRRNEAKYIKAFKILKLADAKSDKYAECLIIKDGYHNTAWEEKGVMITVLGLWTANTMRMISSPTEPKMIDMYQEISQEEFDKLFDKSMKNLYEARQGISNSSKII
jgi:hypothetical protein